MIWARANGGVTLPRPGSLPPRGREFVRLVRDGNAGSLSLVDVVLGKAQSDSKLGRAIVTLADRVDDFYSELGMAGASDARSVVVALDQFRVGDADSAFVLNAVVQGLPAPERLVQPTNLADAERITEGVTLVMALRRAVSRAIATHEGLTAELGSVVERRYERQGVAFLGQLELACAGADDALRELAADESYEPNDVSAALVKAFADRSRAMGRPLLVRETALGTVVVNEAVEVSEVVSDGAAHLAQRLGRGLVDVGGALGVALLGLLRLLGEGLAHGYAFLRAHVAARLTLVLLALVLLLAAATQPMIGPTRLNAAASVATALPGRLNLPAGAAVDVAVRTTGGYTLDDVMAYFGLTDEQATSYFIWYNAGLIRDLQNRLPKGKAFSTPLPAGIVLHIPAVTANSGDPAALAREFGTQADGIRRLNPDPKGGVWLLPVGREGKLGGEAVRTEAVDLRINAPGLEIGKVAP